MDGVRTFWDENTTKIFLDLCIREKEKLNCNKKGLTKLGWQNLYRNFRQQTGRSYDSKQLQNKFNSLKRVYKSWRKLKDKSGGGWDSKTSTICDDECWEDQIAGNSGAVQFRGKALPHGNEMTILFGSIDSDGGGIGDRMPNAGNDNSPARMSEDNVGRSSVGYGARREGKEHVVDSPPLEYYVECISESMLERSRNESSAIRRGQEEVTELLKRVEQDGVSQGSELFFIATELFRSPARRAAFRSINAAENRIAWLRWTWDNVEKK
ncbi:hypothetical protein BS78_06G267600 [Paspalum vaginatum]|nr:hypothetical protein BS78_06G267600 [Paspalum vaginatum]